jgi:hypothetical protein
MFEQEEADLLASIDNLAESVGGWRAMPDACFDDLLGRYLDEKNWLLAGVLAKHSAFQAELQRRIADDIESGRASSRSKKTNAAIWIGRLGAAFLIAVLLAWAVSHFSA